jgi:hypothetical protein
MPANYNYARLAGSCILGAFFASFATFVSHEVSPKPQTLLIFIPFIVVFTRVLLWMWKRGDMATADLARRRYENGELPLGGEEVDDISSEGAPVDHKAPSDDEE